MANLTRLAFGFGLAALLVLFVSLSVPPLHLGMRFLLPAIVTALAGVVLASVALSRREPRRAAVLALVLNVAVVALPLAATLLVTLSGFPGSG